MSLWIFLSVKIKNPRMGLLKTQCNNKSGSEETISPPPPFFLWGGQHGFFFLFFGGGGVGNLFDVGA